MCTALSFKAKDAYFGRNLDWTESFGEKIIITPRNYNFDFKKAPSVKSHGAIIGVALEHNGYPLYFDAINQFGLGIAGLNFPLNAVYNTLIYGKHNITPYEFIPWVLCNCKTISDAKTLISDMNFLDIPANENLPLTPLHWIISDQNDSIVVEPLKDGVKIYDNPLGVLTNNPPFEMQMMNLNNFMNLSTRYPQNRFSEKIELSPYSLGMGAIGLPGDASSQSRFVRASFTRLNCLPGNNENENVSTFFHILSSVEQVKGCVFTDKGDAEYTLYSCCANLNNGTYYVKNYYNLAVNKICMHDYDLSGCRLIISDI